MHARDSSDATDTLLLIVKNANDVKGSSVNVTHAKTALINPSGDIMQYEIAETEE